MTEDRAKRKLSAILSADVKGYSRLMADDEEATVQTINAYREVMTDLIKNHGGRTLDAKGDNVLAEFSSVVDAVRCAIQVQKELKDRNSELPEHRQMEFRIGINLGDVIEEQGNIYGDGVNIAARLEGLAEGGGICISGTAFDHVKNKISVGYEYQGKQSVKNIPDPVRVYKVLLDPKAAGKVIDEEEPITRKKRWIALAAVIVLVVAAGGLYWNFYVRTDVAPASIDKMTYPLPDKPSIAVLPFDNMSGDPEQDYIGDGLSENIISALSVSSEIFVIARNTTFTYKGKAVDIKQVAEDLGVQYVLEGSIQKSGDRLRVTAQFIDALPGHHLWSNVYDREMKELFDLQDEITKRIVVSIGVELGGGDDLRVYAKSTDNLEAWKSYIKGTELMQKFNPGGYKKAQEYFKVATSIDPGYVAAWVNLAKTHHADGFFGWSASPSDSFNRAFELLQKGLKLDEQDEYAHAALGNYYLIVKGQYEKAISEGNRAIMLNPNFADGHASLAMTMMYSGYFTEAVTLMKKALRLNPNAQPIFLFTLAESYIFLGRCEEALEIINKLQELASKGKIPRLFPLVEYCFAYQELGEEEEARAFMNKALKFYPVFSTPMLKKLRPYKYPEHLQRIIDACRKAGMPEKPPKGVQ